MAAFSVWVDGVTGDDARDGLTHAKAVKTMSAAATLTESKADGSVVTVNVVNSGSYTMDASQTTVTIEAIPASTVIVQGTDSSGVAALVTVLAPATGACTFLNPRSILAFTIQGFDVDFTPSVADATAQQFIYSTDTDAGPRTVRYCRFRASTLGGALAAGIRKVLFETSFPTDIGSIEYCVLENMDIRSPSGGASQAHQFHHNVVIFDTTEGVASKYAIPHLPSASNDVRIHHNTVYIEIDDTSTGNIDALFDHNGASGDQGRMDFYDNVLWYNSNKSSSPTTKGFVGGGSGGSFGTGTIGTNIFYTGPEITAVEIGDSYDAAPWSAPYTGDVEVYETADTVLFIAPGSSFNWNANSSGYTLTVARDLRLQLHTTAGQSSGLPGALPSIDVDIAIDVSASDTGPDELDTLTLTVTATNLGTSNEPILVATALVPSGLTYVSEVVSSGAYVDSTGLWTVAVAAAATETLTITVTVDAGTRGDTIVFAGERTSTTGTDTDAGNDRDTTVLVIGSMPGQAFPPEYLDVLPFFQPVYKVNFDPTFIQDIAGIEQDLLSFYQQRPDTQRCSEWTSRRIVIAANTTIEINMGGVDNARILLIEASAVVNVAVGGELGSLTWPIKELAVNSDFSELHIQNPDSTDAVTVQLIIVD